MATVEGVHEPTSVPAIPPRGDRPRLLQLFEPPLGGVPNYVFDVSAALHARGWDVTVAGPRRERLAACAAALGLEYVPLRLAHGLSPRDPFSIRSLMRVIERARIDVVHAHSTKASLLGGVSALIAGVPSVYTPHAWAFQRTSSPTIRAAYARVERLLASRAHCAILVVAQSELDAAATWGINPEHGVQLIQTGLGDGMSVSRMAARRALNIPTDAPVVLWVGRRAPQKRPADLVPLARALTPHGIELIALGQGLADPPCGPLLIAAGVRLLPPSTDPILGYAAADAFVATSEWEGLPLTVLEAMRAGLPVVAYGVGGLREQVEDGVTGHLVSVGDVLTLAARIHELMADPLGRATMGQAGRARLGTRFGRSRMLELLEKAYLKAAGLDETEGL